MTDTDPRDHIPGLARFALTAMPGAGTITVNGQDLTDSVRRATVVMDRGEVPILMLEMRGTGTVEGEGIVQVVPDGQGGVHAVGDAVVEFLEAVDPQALEVEAMALAGLAESPIVGALRALKQAAREQA